VWAPIDQVPDEDDEGIARRALGEFPVDLFEKPIQQIVPAVDVADDISAIAARARGKLLLPCEIEHACLAPGYAEFVRAGAITVQTRLFP
jgi:hypothetical protein